MSELGRRAIDGVHKEGKIPRIFVTGLTSTSLGGLEYHNLGNYIIVEPFFEQLRKTFPDAELVTSLQMTDCFYAKFNIRPVRAERFWQYGYKTARSTMLDVLRVLLWKGLGVKKGLSSLLLKEIHKADLVIDFSGDIYGDNARWNKFLEGNARLAFAILLNKPVAMLIGSPGPFGSFWRQWLAKTILPRLSLVTNREPLSTSMLAYIGVKGRNIQSTACPSVLFQKTPFSEDKCRADYEKIFRSQRQVAGLILCGWNMPVGPFNKWPRADWEFERFRELVDYVLEETSHRLCIMTHQNDTDGKGGLIKGNDHRIIDRFVELLGRRVDGDRIYKLEGLYDAGESKFIISHFDFLISGRIHGAVQALSQEIPTLILDYGHEPRPHKLAGFARVYGIDDYLVEPRCADSIKSGLQKFISNKDRIRADLKTRVPSVRENALRNFDLVSNLLKTPV